MAFFSPVFRKLRYKTLFFFLCTGILPTLFIGSYLLVKIRSDILDNVQATQRHFIETIRSSTSRQLGQYEDQLNRLGQEMDIQSLSEKRIARSFSHFLFLGDLFYSLFFFDRSGHLVWLEYKSKYQGNNHLIGTDIFATNSSEFSGLREKFQLTKKNRVNLKERWSDPTYHQTYLQLLTPVFSFEDPGEVIGVISARVRLKSFELENLVDFYPLRSNEYTMITDYDGNVYVQRGEITTRPLRKVLFKNDDRLIEPGQIGSSVFAIEGEKHLISFAKIDDFELIVIFGQPYENAVSFLVTLLETMIILLLLIAVCAAALGIYFSENLTGPILALVEGINRVGSGATSHRIEILRDDELGQASSAFNKMANNLQKQQFMESVWLKVWKAKK